MALTYEHIQSALVNKFGEAITNWQIGVDMASFEAPKEANLKVLQFLYEESSLLRTKPSFDIVDCCNTENVNEIHFACNT